MNYIRDRIDMCTICEHFDRFPFQEPCKSCQHRETPLEPAKILVIRGNKYILEEKKDELKTEGGES